MGLPLGLKSDREAAGLSCPIEQQCVAAAEDGHVVCQAAHWQKGQGKAAHCTKQGKEAQKIALARSVSPNEDVQGTDLEIFQVFYGFEATDGNAFKPWHTLLLAVCFLAALVVAVLSMEKVPSCPSCPSRHDQGRRGTSLVYHWNATGTSLE